MKKRVAYFTNIAPHYRQGLWTKMLEDQDIEFHFFYGYSIKNGIKQIRANEMPELTRKQLHNVRNVRFKSVVVYQLGVLFNVLVGKFDAYIFLGDMYIISNWIGAVIARMRKKKIFYWGHGLYGNESPLKEFVRKVFLSLADAHFLYGNYGKTLMAKHGFPKEILHVVHNSLQYDAQRSIREQLIDSNFFCARNYFNDNSLPVLIFIGRLTARKKLLNLLTAIELLKQRKVYVNLLLIGDGPERSSLEVAASGIKGQVHFYGPCYNEHEIGKHLANASLCVSPGDVGLTAIHSMSFGTPVCTHGDMSRQMPEAEAIVPVKTGILYDRIKDDLDIAIENWITRAIDRQAVRQYCYETIDAYYNPHFQMSVFKKVLFAAF